MLGNLWISTANLHKRFDAGKSPLLAMRLVEEEFREFKEEVTQTEVDKIKLTNEAVDLLVTVMGVLQALDVKQVEFERATYRVVDKNNDKTEETHTVDVLTGKITRIKTT